MALTGAASRRFDILSKRAERESRTREQEQQDALKRQFSRLGGISSGSYVKQSQLAKERAAQRLQTAREGVEFKRLEEEGRQEELDRARKYQTSEREAGQQFAAQQALLGRKYQTSERKAGQRFASSENLLGRQFQTSEREAGQGFQKKMAKQAFKWQKQLADADLSFKKSMFDWQKSTTAKQMDIAERSMQLEEQTFELNSILQRLMAEDMGLKWPEELGATGPALNAGVPEGYKYQDQWKFDPQRGHYTQTVLVRA